MSVLHLVLTLMKTKNAPKNPLLMNINLYNYNQPYRDTTKPGFLMKCIHLIWAPTSSFNCSRASVIFSLWLLFLILQFISSSVSYLSDFPCSIIPFISQCARTMPGHLVRLTQRRSCGTANSELMFLFYLKLLQQWKTDSFPSLVLTWNIQQEADGEPEGGRRGQKRGKCSEAFLTKLHQHY